MRDHSFYILASYGALAIAVIVELLLLRARRRAAIERARDAAESEPA